MVNILINGALGRMGKKVYEAVCLNDNAKVVCGIDVKEENTLFPIYNSFDKVTEKVDVIIDFSSPVVLDKLLNFAVNTNTPVVLCTTGYTAEDIEKINNASKKVALFRSANMSLGVNAVIELVKEATKLLYGFDIEIIEKHHNQKVDSPSGTALMLADAVKSVNTDSNFIYGRVGKVGKRTKTEVGIHAVRGGTIVGEHDVLFAGENETITISHSAQDRSVFAFGAVKAAIFLSGKGAGMYNMQNLIEDSKNA